MQVSWESIGAIASLISAATVVGAVIVALRQVRVGALQVDHLRRATQLEGTMKIFDKLNSDEQQRARQFIAFELRERMRDPVFSAEVDLLGYAHGHREIEAMRLLEMIGVYVKHGLLDEEIIFDHWLPAVLNTWRDLDEAGVIARHRAIEGPTMWENFEELHRRGRALGSDPRPLSGPTRIGPAARRGRRRRVLNEVVAGTLENGQNGREMVYDIAVVGGGIVGLATTRELLFRYPSLRIANVEKEDVWSKHQTGHNSGVIHSGIYYKPGSLKAKLCVEGRKLAWEYCDAKGIEFRDVGKLIVATEESELGRLDDLWTRGHQNGIDGLEMLDAAQIAEREPYCRGVKAIFSPVTGIVDWGLVSRSYGDDAKEMGSDMFLGHEVTRIERRGNITVLKTPKGEVQANYVVTCGGLYSDKLGRMTGGSVDPKIVPFRGDYLILKPEKSYLVKGNIYPVPDPEFPFLGVHFTPRMDGSIWLGPNAVLAFAREGYSFFTINPAELWDALTYPGFFKMATKYWEMGAGEMYRDLVRSAYVQALQRYIPELQPEDCLHGPAGVRAQAMTADGGLVDDFVFEGSEGVVHVRNAPSPGATSSLAIGKYIADDAEQRFDLSKKSVAV